MDATTGRPIMPAPQNGPWNAVGTQEGSPKEQGIAGELYGLPVVKDPNIPSTGVDNATTGGTSDIVAVVRETDMRLYEGTLRMRALAEVLSGTLQVRFQCYAYSAFIPDRFAASVSVITGTTFGNGTF
jgi:hypothetical protein